MNANLKRVMEFATCRSAFSQRNITSILLVALFFGVYVMAGGKISTKVPSYEEMNRLGGGLSGPAVSNNKEEAALGTVSGGQEQLDIERSRSILGEKPSNDRAAREVLRQRKGTLFTDEEVVEGEKEKIKKEGLISGVDFTTRREKWLLEKSEKKPEDSLSRIEERLKIGPRKGQ